MNRGGPVRGQVCTGPGHSLRAHTWRCSPLECVCGGGHILNTPIRAPLTRKRHTMPHPAQSQHTNYWAPRTRKRHQQEHRPQWPTERSDPTQHAKGRTGDCPGPRKGATTRRNVTQGGGLRGWGGGGGACCRCGQHGHARPYPTARVN